MAGHGERPRESQRVGCPADALDSVSKHGTTDGPRTAIYTEALARMSSLSDSRRLRLLASHWKVPFVMWVLLWVAPLRRSSSRISSQRPAFAPRR